MANQTFKWSPQALKKLGLSTALITTAALSGCSLLENISGESAASVLSEDESAEVASETDDSVAAVPDTTSSDTTSSRPAPPDGGRGGRGGHDHHDQELSEDAYDPEALVTVDPTTTTDSAASSSGTVTYADEYQDGQYVGTSVAADRWGDMQVVAVIEDGELTQVLIADYPRSTELSDVITRNALPSLITDAITAQDADGINIVSGATDSSRAFIESLDAALEDALILEDGATS